MKKIFFCWAIIGCIEKAIAQTEPVRCGTVEYIEAMDKQLPGFKQAADQAFMNANKLYKEENSTAKTSEASKAEGEWFDTTYCVPVVFHMLINSANTNIPDSLILKSLKELNEDFNRRNADTLSTPADFKNIVSGVNIEFVLATKDPDGKPTTGIIRKNTNILQYNLPTNDALMKTSATDGDLAWNPDKYLNFWTCNLIINDVGSGLLGFAQPPLNHSFWPSSLFVGKSKATDGIALDESVFYSYKRVLTHEVGHYFSLRHIWGDKSNCATPGDYIDDTPDQSENSQSVPCGQTRNTCPETPKPNVEDMKINYMSYHPGNCQNAFSKGQAQQMRSVLKTDRTQLAYVCKIKGQWVSDINNTNPISPIVVSPNPVSDAVSIKVNIESSDVKSIIRVFDNTGRMVHNAFFDEPSYEEKINCGSFETGVYFVEVTTKGFKNTTKFIKQ
jgi:hypothetical protein